MKIYSIYIKKRDWGGRIVKCRPLVDVTGADGALTEAPGMREGYLFIIHPRRMENSTKLFHRTLKRGLLLSHSLSIQEGSH